MSDCDLRSLLGLIVLPWQMSRKQQQAGGYLRRREGILNSRTNHEAWKELPSTPYNLPRQLSLKIYSKFSSSWLCKNNFKRSLLPLHRHLCFSLQISVPSDRARAPKAGLGFSWWLARGWENGSRREGGADEEPSLSAQNLLHYSPTPSLHSDHHLSSAHKHRKVLSLLLCQSVRRNDCVAVT